MQERSLTGRHPTEGIKGRTRVSHSTCAPHAAPERAPVLYSAVNFAPANQLMRATARRGASCRLQILLHRGRLDSL